MRPTQSAMSSMPQAEPSSPRTPDTQKRDGFQRPNFLTVGDGAPSEHAQRLQEILEADSGYGSLSDGVGGKTFSPLMGEDYPQVDWEKAQNGDTEERRRVASHVHQLHYNHNRTTLSRAIGRTVDSLERLKDYNRQWPAHYPSMHVPPTATQHPDPRPGLHHTQSQSAFSPTRSKTLANQPFQNRPQAPKRADTIVSENAVAESSAAASSKPQPEPRLVTPQLSREFSVLKIDLKMDRMTQTEIIHSVGKDPKALAGLLDAQINKSTRHLGALRERIEDTSSKVLVTGDLNAGKSTFCNALLRRKILPEDEQPCTSIFCEVLDWRENSFIEEVHAIPVGSNYDPKDERTYIPFPLSKLESIVINQDQYSQCKVYIKDIRCVDESLLNNGVLDIALIDAPGLNNDSLKTTAVFARQEEIDVVVFVVSAANHFTLSAREFIYDAAREKAFIFMVVNGYDTIRNQQRCQEQILKQVAHLSPATFKEQRELVHFVSSNAIPVAPVGGGGDPDGPGGSGSGSAGASSDPDKGDGDDDNGSDKGKGKEKELQQRQDFDHLEASLRRFVLEKRARSKLAPAKTYLVNVLDDLHALAAFNRDMAQGELDRVNKELSALEPELQRKKKARAEAGEQTDTLNERAAQDVYDHARDTLAATIASASHCRFELAYPGFWDAFSYAEELTAAMMREISDAVGSCEDYGRAKTLEGVNAVKQLGLLHMGDKFAPLVLAPEKMYSKKRDALARHVAVDVELWDFFDFAGLWERQEKVAGTSMAVTLAGVLGGRLVGGVGWIDGALGAAKIVGVGNARRLFVPGVLLAAALAAAYAVVSIPHSLPRRLGNKLAAQLAALDFSHANALRISAEVRRALKVPADRLRLDIEKNFDALRAQQIKTDQVRSESDVARKYFGNLLRESADIKTSVERVDLDGPGPGIAAGFDF